MYFKTTTQVVRRWKKRCSRDRDRTGARRYFDYASELLWRVDDDHDGRCRVRAKATGEACVLYPGDALSASLRVGGCAVDLESGALGDPAKCASSKLRIDATVIDAAKRAAPEAVVLVVPGEACAWRLSFAAAAPGFDADGIQFAAPHLLADGVAFSGLDFLLAVDSRPLEPDAEPHLYEALAATVAGRTALHGVAAELLDDAGITSDEPAPPPRRAAAVAALGFLGGAGPEGWKLVRDAARDALDGNEKLRELDPEAYLDRRARRRLERHNAEYAPPWAGLGGGAAAAASPYSWRRRNLRAFRRNIRVAAAAAPRPASAES